MNGSDVTKRILKVAGAAATLAAVMLGTAVVSHTQTASGSSNVQDGDGSKQSTVTGDRDASANGDNNRVDQRPVGSGGRGDTTVSGAGGPVHTGDGAQNNGPGAGSRSDRHDASSTSDRHDDSSTSSDRHDSADRHDATAAGNGRVNSGAGNQDNHTVNNFPTDPPTPGEVRLVSVAASDGGPTLSSEVVFTVDATKLPNDGNRLFLVCRRSFESPSTPDLYYARAEITVPGRQKLTIGFGGRQADDPAVIGTVRGCAVWTSDPGASRTIAQLMYFDSRGIDDDPDGQPYDAQRTSMPDGSTAITDELQVRVDRLARSS